MGASLGIGQSIGLMGGDDSVEIIGLGSCVAVFLAVPDRFLAAAHVLLPGPPRSGDGYLPGKYMTTAIPHLISLIASQGIALESVRAAIVGGAKAFSFEGERPELTIGSTNVDVALRLLEEREIEVAQVETGGRLARSVSTPVRTGVAEVRLRKAVERSSAVSSTASAT